VVLPGRRWVKVEMAVLRVELPHRQVEAGLLTGPEVVLAVTAEALVVAVLVLQTSTI
jgi:hypothetical protein